jgi:hypothetical protein
MVSSEKIRPPSAGAVRVYGSVRRVASLEEGIGWEGGFESADLGE